MSFGRPLGQCCQNCRQHCTGLALRTPGSPLRCLHAVRTRTASRRAVPAVACARAARADSRRRAVRATLGPRHTAPSERSRAAAEREPSAMLPAVSAALAERSRGGAARFASTPRTEPHSPPSPRAPHRSFASRKYLRRAIVARCRSLPIAHSASPRPPPTGPTPRRPRPRAATSARRPASARAP